MTSLLQAKIHIPYNRQKKKTLQKDYSLEVQHEALLACLPCQIIYHNNTSWQIGWPEHDVDAFYVFLGHFESKAIHSSSF
jgi:hypothetical protein